MWHGLDVKNFYGPEYDPQQLQDYYKYEGEARAMCMSNIRKNGFGPRVL